MSVKEQWPVGIRADQDLHGPVDANALLVQSGQLLPRPGNGGIDIDTTCPTLDLDIDIPTMVTHCCAQEAATTQCRAAPTSGPWAPPGTARETCA